MNVTNYMYFFFFIFIAKKEGRNKGSSGKNGEQSPKRSPVICATTVKLGAFQD